MSEAAILFKVPPRQVKAWMYRERVPRPKKGLFIEKVTAKHPAGSVKFADIYKVAA